MNTFTIDEKLPSLNDVIKVNRNNRYEGNIFKHRVQHHISLYIRDALEKGTLKKVTSYPVIIDIQWHERTKKRDADNIVAGGRKYILDAMVEEGILENDSRKYVKGFTDEIIDGKNDYVVVTIREP